VSSMVQSLEVSYLLQATEDEEKVGRAVAGLLGKDLQPERLEAEGHHGNRIVWIRHHLTGEEAEAGLRRIVSLLGREERTAVLEDLGSSLDEYGALYLRFSKQVLVMDGTVVLARSDPIRVKVKPRSRLVRGGPAEFYARLFEEGARP
jgi:RNA binding exosome subunit